MAIDQTERAARNQSLFREVNERVVELEQCGFQETNGNGSTVRAVCECADGLCHERIELGIGAYEAIRSSPLLFLVSPGHEWPEVDRVVSEHEGYVVVETFWRSDATAMGLETARAYRNGRGELNGRPPR
jgi:hypothetical protein